MNCVKFEKRYYEYITRIIKILGLCKVKGDLTTLKL